MEEDLLMLNNVGVTSILLRNYDSAIATLERSLTKVLQVALVAQTKIDPAWVHAVLDPQTKVCFGDPYMAPCEQHSTSLFLHEKGILLDMEPDAYSSDQPSNALMLSATIAYNLALAYHLRSTRSGAGLRQSIEMYLLSGTLLIGSGFDKNQLNPTGTAIARFVALSVVNNMGYASFQMADYPSATVCFKLLVVLVTNCEEPSKDARYDLTKAFRKHKLNYLLNADALTNGKLSPAA